MHLYSYVRTKGGFRISTVILFFAGSAGTDVGRWEPERSFDTLLCRKYFCKKLLKSDNLSSGYSR